MTKHEDLKIRTLIHVDGSLFDPEGNYRITSVNSSCETREIGGKQIPGHAYVYDLGLPNATWQLKIWIPDGAANPREEMSMVIVTPNGEVKIEGQNKETLYGRMVEQVSQEAA